MNIGQQGQLKHILPVAPGDLDMVFGRTRHSATLSGARRGRCGEIRDSRGRGRFRDLDELLSVDIIREIIEIIRFKSAAETDLIKAYDYLRSAGPGTGYRRRKARRKAVRMPLRCLRLDQFYAATAASCRPPRSACPVALPIRSSRWVTTDSK